jgi:hypothetical protein
MATCAGESQMADKADEQLSNAAGAIIGAPVGAAPGLRGAGDSLDVALQYVRQALAGLQFGQIAIIVQDGVVVQVERTERKRFRRGGEHRA